MTPTTAGATPTGQKRGGQTNFGNVWSALRRGEVSRETVWRDYCRNLDLFLVDAERVVDRD
jgi:hypothetical protein